MRNRRKLSVISHLNLWAICFLELLFSSIRPHQAGAGESPAQPIQASNQIFRAGASAVDITPTTLPSIIAGGFLEAQANAVSDRLFVRSIVLDDGATQLTLTVVDTCMMTQELIDQAKQLASSQCGIAMDRMMISATHTHSAPAAMSCLGTRQDTEYTESLPSKIAEAIVAAHGRLEPARIGWASIDDWEHTHNRRWIRKPESQVQDPYGGLTGRAHMHPGYLSSDVIGPSGPVDPALTVLSIQTRAGRPLALLANYSQHYFGAAAVSADYYGLFCKHIASLLNEPGEGNGPFVCAMSQGTSGDLMWMDYGSAAEQMSMNQYAEAVATYAERALGQVAYHEFVPLGIVEQQLTLAYRVPDEQRLNWARPIAAKIEANLPKSLPEVYANEALILHERQTAEVKLQSIRIGDLTIATLPNEVYALSGLKLRGRSPFTNHFNIELANGAVGYIPPPEQHQLGGYTTWPARTAGLEVAAETKIIDALTRGLEQVTGQPRREMFAQAGEYAMAVHAARPLGYWRLDDSDGKTPKNEVLGGPIATLSEGFAWYLPGAGSGSGIGDREELTTSGFNGPRQFNRAVHLAGGQFEVAPLPISRDVVDEPITATITVWFWLGEPSGASERFGEIIRLPDGQQLIARQHADHTVQLELGKAVTAPNWQADQWHFLSMVCTPDRIQVFVDDAEEPSLQTEGTRILRSDHWRFGEQLQGKIDEIAIFPRDLSTDEIQSLWKASGIAEQRAGELRERLRRLDEAAARTQPPNFAADYPSQIFAMNPLVLEPLNTAPAVLASDGSVDFSNTTFATLLSGRLAGHAEQMRDSFSISMWFRNEIPNHARPVTAYLFSRGPKGDSQAPGDHVGIGGNYNADFTGKLIWFNGNARGEVAVGRTMIRPESWNHVVAVRDADRIRVWLNGKPEPEIDSRIDLTASGIADFFVGARSDYFAPLNGNLAYVAIFDRALDVPDVTRLFTASGQSIGVPIETAAVVANWPTSEPLSAEKSKSLIHVARGFRAELVAAEPQVVDPVAMDWDARGRLWVVEMSDYPLGVDGAGKAGGRVRVLEDLDDDGHFETSRIFAEGLNFPNGLLTWRDGVLVTAAPQILFLRDTDNDGRMDVQEVLFDGFQEGNQQLRLNALRWGIDNWVYCANGGHHANYGVDTRIRSLRSGQIHELGSHDFRFQPDTGALELESGPSQFGRNRDAWGNWFGTQNAHPLWHYVFADRYLNRNPYVPTPKPIHYVVPGSSPEVHPASSPEKRFHSFQEAGHFTSACSGMIYGDQRLFGATNTAHAFTCEPFHNLVQHNLLFEDGTSFRSERPQGEGPFDFFASEDRWCRPVMVRTGPDGGLWIADMYRYMIEHPDWLPPDGKSELLPHYRLGDDRGRIYRVIPNVAAAACGWKFTDDQPATLVAALESSNDWRRDKAQQMLLWAADPLAVPLLKQLLRTSAVPEARVHALFTLVGFDAIAPDDVRFALSDTHPRVRENALRIAECLDSPEIRQAAYALSGDIDARVCLQLALTLGEWSDKQAGDTLVELAQRFHHDSLMVDAIMSSALAHASVFAAGVSSTSAETFAVFREPILRQAIGSQDIKVMAMLIERAFDGSGVERMRRIDELLTAFQAMDLSLEKVFVAHSPTLEKLADIYGQLQGEMLALAADPSAGPQQRIAAARLLVHSEQYIEQGARSLAEWLKPQISNKVQAEVLAIYQQCSSPAVPELLADAWPGLSPDLRTQALDVWLARAAWANALLDCLEAGTIHAASLDLAQRDRLFQFPDAKVADRAQHQFAKTANSTRNEVVGDYRTALDLPSDAERGKAVFIRACASCHQIMGQGFEVGPNLATVAGHTPEKLLVNILHPNADIQPGYHAYSVLLLSGEVLSGLLAAETANSLTLKQVNGNSRIVARSEIELLHNSNISLMPEGLETMLSHQDLADLILFLRQPTSTDSSQ